MFPISPNALRLIKMNIIIRFIWWQLYIVVTFVDYSKWNSCKSSVRRSFILIKLMQMHLSINRRMIYRQYNGHKFSTFGWWITLFTFFFPLFCPPPLTLFCRFLLPLFILFLFGVSLSEIVTLNRIEMVTSTLERIADWSNWLLHQSVEKWYLKLDWHFSR